MSTESSESTCTESTEPSESSESSPTLFLYGFKHCPHLVAHGPTCGLYHSGLGAGNRTTCACPPGLVELKRGVRDLFPKHLCPACEKEHRRIHPGIGARLTPRWILERRGKGKGKTNSGDLEECTPLLT
ncbi:hypothetical protein DSL72_005274 [Monilinia vaccinii-corymbosi]|uniref:Uncharacterized protein n=1 Tax=Monilinia vaccinii-corymbosi TaxID=61207 RepID=A0A8A3PF69_9HELO|nr:hypothetical protein DSL72_005274 [Monilinia vaccinii-corymbosi]